jgi:hypothetical protein
LNELVEQQIKVFFDQYGTVSMKLPSGWLGRPYDNLYSLEAIARVSNMLTLTFDYLQLRIEGDMWATRRPGETEVMEELRLHDVQSGGWRYVQNNAVGSPQGDLGRARSCSSATRRRKSANIRRDKMADGISIGTKRRHLDSRLKGVFDTSLRR